VVKVETERQPCVPIIVGDDARLGDSGSYRMALN
jgi:hypothetical protein